MLKSLEFGPEDVKILEAVEEGMKDLEAVEVEEVVRHLPLNVEDKNLFN